MHCSENGSCLKKVWALPNHGAHTFYSATDHFTLVLPDLSFSEGISSSLLPVLEFPPVPGGSRFDEEILSFCYGKAKKSSEIADHLGISDSTHLKEKILGALVTNGSLTREKVSRVFFLQNKSGHGP